MGKPMYEAFSVRNYTVGREQKAHWTKIGVIFPHKNGDGFDVVLSALPIGDRIVCRVPFKDEAEQGAEPPPDWSAEPTDLAPEGEDNT